MRLRSDIFVSALLRRCAVEGVVAVLRKRGSAEAGAIFVKVDRLDGRAALFGPAPQSETMPPGIDRWFTRLHATETLDPSEVEAKIARERRFDSDLWLVEVEDPAGRCFLDLAPE